MKQKVKLTEGQLKQIVENASRMVIQEMFGDGSFSREMGDMGRMGRNVSKNDLNFMPNTNNSAYKPSSLLNFMPSKSGHKSNGLYKPSGLSNFMPYAYQPSGFYRPTGPFNFMPPSAYPYGGFNGFNGFNGMAFNNDPGMYFPNGFYPGYQG
jgi:hypothetical protein